MVWFLTLPAELVGGKNREKKLEKETISQAAKRLKIAVGKAIGCADGVYRPVKKITDKGIRVVGSRELIDPRQLKLATAE